MLVSLVKSVAKYAMSANEESVYNEILLLTLKKKKRVTIPVSGAMHLKINNDGKPWLTL